jgi:hypothetical protein
MILPLVSSILAEPTWRYQPPWQTFPSVRKGSNGFPLNLFRYDPGGEERFYERGGMSWKGGNGSNWTEKRVPRGLSGRLRGWKCGT